MPSKRFAFWTFVVFYVCLAVLARYSPYSSRIEQPQPWDGEQEFGLYVEGGTYGLEFRPDFYWLRDRTLRLRLVNRTDHRVRGIFSFILGPTVCGSIARVEGVSSPKELKLEQVENRYQGEALIAKRSHQTLVVHISGPTCKVDGDPRHFLGSISTLIFVVGN